MDGITHLEKYIAERDRLMQENAKLTEMNAALCGDSHAKESCDIPRVIDQ